MNEILMFTSYFRPTKLKLPSYKKNQNQRRFNWPTNEQIYGQQKMCMSSKQLEFGPPPPQKKKNFQWNFDEKSGILQLTLSC